jgi:SAM-dependent methyltransferase
MTSTTTIHKTNIVNRIRSKQSGHPAGLLGRVFGRAMVKDTAPANDRAIDALALPERATVLEIGFGQGRTVQRLISQGHTVMGVEASATMVSQASARNRHAVHDDRAELVLGDGVTVPFADDSVDAALTVHTIYFMSEPQTTLNEIARVLRPGGRLAIGCRVSDDGVPAWMDPNVYRIPSSEWVTQMLTEAGFVAISLESGDASNQWTSLFTAELAD